MTNLVQLLPSITAASFSCPQCSTISDHNRVDAAKEMAFWDALFEVEQIEQLALIDRLPTHHDPPPPLKPSTKRNHDSPIITSDFFNTIGHFEPSSFATGTEELAQIADANGANLLSAADRRISRLAPPCLGDGSSPVIGPQGRWPWLRRWVRTRLSRCKKDRETVASRPDMRPRPR